MFWQKKNDNDKKPINSLEYDICLKRIAELNSKVSTFETSINAIEEKLENMRYSIRTKFKIAKDEPKEEQDKTESVINGGFVAFG